MVLTTTVDELSLVFPPIGLATGEPVFFNPATNGTISAVPVVQFIQVQLTMRLLLTGFIVIAMFATDAIAGQRYARNNGNWNGNIWSTTSGGTVGAATPGSGDTVYISVGAAHTVTIPSSYSASCALLIMGETTTSNAATLNLGASTSSLSISGHLLMKAASNSATRLVSIGDGTLTIGGNLTMNEGQTNNGTSRKCSLYVNNGTVTIGGDLSYVTPTNGNPDQNVITLAGSATINLAGAHSVVNGKGKLQPGTASTFNYNGTSTQTMTFSDDISYYNININNTAGVTVTQSVGTGNIAGDFRILSGTFDNGGYAIVGALLKTFEVANGATFKMTGTTGMVTGFTFKIFGDSSTCNYAGANQTVSNESYGHLVLSSSGGTSVTKTMPSGSLTTAGNLTSSATGTGTSVTFSALGSMTIGGNVWIGASTTMNGGSYTHTVRGNWTDDGTFNGSTGTISIAGTTSQTIGGASTTTFRNLTIANTSAVVYATQNFNVAGTMTVNANAIFSPYPAIVINNGTTQGTLTGAGTVRVSRITTPANFVSQYLFSTRTLTNLTLDFVGTAAQYLNVTSMGGLRIANSHGVGLNNSVTVLNTLTLYSGNIYTQADTLTLGSANWSTGTLSRTSGYIIGTFRRWFNSLAISNVEFPLGYSVYSRSINLSYTVAPLIGGTLTATFHSATPTGEGLPLWDNTFQVKRVLGNGYWTITAGNGLSGGIYSLELSPEGFNDFDSVEVLRIVKRPNSASSWSAPGTHLLGLGTLLSPLVRRSGLSGFSDFAIGTDGERTLPVELVSFTAAPHGDVVDLEWRTASETHNEGFDIERGIGDEKGEIAWGRIGFAAGHGTTSAPQRYQWRDEVGGLRAPGENRQVQYRLRQVDHDGTFSYSDLVSVELMDPATRARLMGVYPNPFLGTTEVEYVISQQEQARLEICDIFGTVIATLVDGEETPGLHRVRFDAVGLPAGVYYCRLTSGSYSAVRPIAHYNE
jgi:hypothetical protein